MNTVEIDTTMTTTATFAENEQLNKIAALDQWSYETFLLKDGSD